MLKALALENFWTPVFSKTKNQVSGKKQAVAPGRYWLAVGLIAANAILLMSYIYGVNDYASKGYEIKSLQNRLSVLTQEGRKINLKVSEATSMVSIQQDFLSSNFVPAGTSKFLETSQLTQR